MEKRKKTAYICRQVDDWSLQADVPSTYCPQVGDVGVFEVMQIGKHRSIQCASKLKATIVEGDHMLGAFGTRYATAQFEGNLPDNVNQELHILGAGGVVGIVERMHSAYEEIGPTAVRLIGLAADHNGNVVNTKELMQWELIPFSGAAASKTRVILSVGSAMDSGKTTSAAHLVHGLKRSECTVAYVKLTGTAYSKDCDLAWDMGSDIVADFSDYGFPSTYMCSKQELLSLYETLLSRVLQVRPDYVIMEIADGLYQRETKALLADHRFAATITGVMFSAGDSIAALSGARMLSGLGLGPSILSGLFSASPMLVREVSENIDVPVMTIEDLGLAGNLDIILARSPTMLSKC
ncbi:MAG: hypothetical protein H0W86_02585 [Armatimonadetes bacterium]|nr:hypothetical protein [Armatimonadota bacterium]